MAARALLQCFENSPKKQKPGRSVDPVYRYPPLLEKEMTTFVILSAGTDLFKARRQKHLVSFLPKASEPTRPYEKV